MKWKLSNKEYEYIKEVVAHIFEFYNIKCVPVSGFEIASKMNIKLIAYSTLSKKKREALMKCSGDGAYREEGIEEIIYYNDIDRNYERQNMTILHEIGHCVLDHTGNSKNEKKEEAEANFFAKYAIAPPILICKMGLKTVDEIYSIFDISYEAANYAYDYYIKWLKKTRQRGRLMAYDKKILHQYGMCA